MDWVQMDEDVMLAHLPTDVLARYQTWLVGNPDRAGRLADLTRNAVTELRDNLRTNPANVLDPDPIAVPVSTVRHLETIITYQLAMEMGLSIDPAGTQGMTRAEMFLRQCAYNRFTTTSDDPEAGGPSPSYALPSPHAARALCALGVLLLLNTAAQAGWIRPGSTLFDTDIQATLYPTFYTNSAFTLYGHLVGINGAIGALQARAVDATPIANAVAAEAAVRMSVDDGLSTMISAQAAAIQGALNTANNAYGTALAAELKAGVADTNALDAFTLAGTALARADEALVLRTTTNAFTAIENTNRSPGLILEPGATISGQRHSRGIDFIATQGGAVSTGTMTGVKLLTTRPAWQNETGWHYILLDDGLAAYQTVAGFNAWSTNRLQWVGPSPATRHDAGAVGQVRGEGTNLFIRMPTQWARLLVDMEALPE